MKDELDIPIWDCLETVDDISNFQVRLYNWGKRQATFTALREAPAASPAVPLGGILYQLPASCPLPLVAESWGKTIKTEINY